MTSTFWDIFSEVRTRFTWGERIQYTVCCCWHVRRLLCVCECPQQAKQKPFIKLGWILNACSQHHTIMKSYSSANASLWHGRMFKGHSFNPTNVKVNDLQNDTKGQWLILLETNDEKTKTNRISDGQFLCIFVTSPLRLWHSGPVCSVWSFKPSCNLIKNRPHKGWCVVLKECVIHATMQLFCLWIIGALCPAEKGCIMLRVRACLMSIWFGPLYRICWE